jgi:ABC-type Zn uptake system ZnuABC Zn-binding protein ZnuA
MNSLLMLEAIESALITLLPEHTLLIQYRKVLLEEAFQDIIELYEALVPENQELEIVFAGHNAFGYWETYDIHVLTPYPGFSSEVVPTAQSIIDFQNLMASLASQILYISSTDNQAVIDALLESNPNLTTAILSTLENISQIQREEGITYQELLLLNYEALSLNEN